MKKGARVLDPHVCPLQAPAPHVGGPVKGPGATTVLLEHMPGCVVGDECTCATGVDVTLEATASGSVFYEGKKAVRVGDLTTHGGSITKGAAKVYVGD